MSPDSNGMTTELNKPQKPAMSHPPPAPCKNAAELTRSRTVQMREGVKNSDFRDAFVTRKSQYALDLIDDYLAELDDVLAAFQDECSWSASGVHKCCELAYSDMEEGEASVLGFCCFCTDFVDVPARVASSETWHKSICDKCMNIDKLVTEYEYWKWETDYPDDATKWHEYQRSAIAAYVLGKLEQHTQSCADS